MKAQDPVEASRYALLLILALGESNETEFARQSKDLAKKSERVRRGVNEVLCSVTLQLLQHVHKDDWLASVRLQLLNLDIDPDHYAKANT
ncbi:hypothetical protein ACFYLX_03665 [Pseudarthrobacter enclensis]|uniref:hypothetical protein n=1 Tax=Pseudarthrobacter enclensis TaxID=993070 RepID=UPI0036B41A21